MLITLKFLCWSHQKESRIQFKGNKFYIQQDNIWYRILTKVKRINLPYQATVIPVLSEFHTKRTKTKFLLLPFHTTHKKHLQRVDMNPKIETFFDAKPVLRGNFKKFPNNSFHIKEKKNITETIQTGKKLKTFDLIDRQPRIRFKLVIVGQFSQKNSQVHPQFP